MGGAVWQGRIAYHMTCHVHVHDGFTKRREISRRRCRAGAGFVYEMSKAKEAEGKENTWSIEATLYLVPDGNCLGLLEIACVLRHSTKVTHTCIH